MGIIIVLLDVCGEVIGAGEVFHGAYVEVVVVLVIEYDTVASNIFFLINE